MSRYAPLFHLAVSHEFFEAGRIRGLTLAPTKTSAHAIANLGLLYRADRPGGSVFYDRDRPDGIRLACADPEQALVLEFAGFSGDPDFGFYTDRSPGTLSSIFVFRNGRSPDGLTERLHETEHASAADVSDFDERAYRREHRRAVPPDFLVRIRIGGESTPLEELVTAPRRYSIAFAAASSFWKYYLIGAHPAEAYRIGGAPGIAEFSERPAESLADATPVRTFVSDRAIALRERYAAVPQLRAGDLSEDRLLIRHLPVAAADCRTSAAADNNGAFVSELYVNF